jgi:uncharacterized protein involved in exopolysaccharide biosynthesis
LENIEKSDSEISIKIIFDILLKSKKSIALATFTMALVGVFYSLLQPVQFTTSAKVLPEITQSSSSKLFSGFSSIAGLAGMDIDNLGNTDAIRPTLYPDIVQSTPFAIEILNRPIITSDGEKFETLGHYLAKGSKKTKLSSAISSFFDVFKSKENKKASYTKLNNVKEDQYQKFTKIQESIIRSFKGRVTSSIDKKTGVIALSVKMPDAKVAASVCNEALKSLRVYVVDYRLGKLSTYEKFLEQRTVEAKARYERARYNLSNFRDRNKNMILLVPKTQEDELKYEYDLAFGLYLEVSKKLEQTKIQAQNETPVLKILEPPTEPLRKSEPKRTIMVLTYTFIGLIFSVIYNIFKKIDWSTINF